MANAFKYGLCADLHFHDWSLFSKTLPSGVNSRLQAQIDEFERMVDEMEASGITRVFIAGDVFHTRGSIKPEVFNPVHAMFVRLKQKYPQVHFYISPGNHDLSTMDATELGNATKTLAEIENVHVFSVEPESVVIGSDGNNITMFPWRSDWEALYAELEEYAATLIEVELQKTDVLIHAGVDGIIEGLPDRGLTAERLASLGFRRVFAGHYHHHKVMEDGKVFSIGATTHQTWGDVDSNAGYLIIDETSVNYRASHAPMFMDFDAIDPDDVNNVPMLVEGNYVRMRGQPMDEKEIEEFRELLFDFGAAGVSVEVPRKTVSMRTGAVATSTSRTLEQSVEAYIDDNVRQYVPQVKAVVSDILTSVSRSE